MVKLARRLIIDIKNKNNHNNKSTRRIHKQLNKKKNLTIIGFKEKEQQKK